MYLYREDDRPKSDIEKAGGFYPYCPQWTLEKAKLLIKLLCGSDLQQSEKNKLPEFVLTEFSPVQRIYDKKWIRKSLKDLSQHIKYTVNKTTTFWVSTAVNKECGGRGKKYRYTIEFPELYQFDVGQNILVKVDERKNVNHRTLVLDTNGLTTATIIALNHGPLADAEFSFLSPIPATAIAAVEDAKS